MVSCNASWGSGGSRSRPRATTTGLQCTCPVCGCRRWTTSGLRCTNRCIRPGAIQPAPGIQPAPDDTEATQPIGHSAPMTLAVLDTRTLLVAAITGTSIPLMFAGAAAAFGRIHDLLPERALHRITGEVFSGGRVTVLIMLAAVAAAVIAGIVLTSLRLANFTLIRDGDRLRISRGLLAQRSGTIPVDRVQAVRVVQGWWRRILGYCALEVEVAGISTSNDAERMLFPLVRMTEAAALVALALPELRWHPTPLRSVPGRARRRYLTLPVLLSLVATMGLALLPGWGRYLALAPDSVGAARRLGAGQCRGLGDRRRHRDLPLAPDPGPPHGDRPSRPGSADRGEPHPVPAPGRTLRHPAVAVVQAESPPASHGIRRRVDAAARRRPPASSRAGGLRRPLVLTCPPRTVNGDGRQQPTLTPPPLPRSAGASRRLLTVTVLSVLRSPPLPAGTSRRPASRTPCSPASPRPRSLRPSPSRSLRRPRSARHRHRRVHRDRRVSPPGPVRRPTLVRPPTRP